MARHRGGWDVGADHQKERNEDRRQGDELASMAADQGFIYFNEAGQRPTSGRGQVRPEPVQQRPSASARTELLCLVEGKREWPLHGRCKMPAPRGDRIPNGNRATCKIVLAVGDMPKEQLEHIRRPASIRRATLSARDKSVGPRNQSK